MTRLATISGYPLGSLAFTGLVLACALFAELLAPADPNRQDLQVFLAPPSVEYWMGTDALGRDILSRVIHGARISLLVAVAAVGLAGLVGTVLGIASALLAGWLGEAIMRVAEVFLTLPTVLIALAVAATVGPSLTNVVLIIALVYWAQFARMVRGEALSLRERDHVQAARALGCSTARLVVRHILPNLVSTVIVLATLQVASAILLESTLSFLGVGVPPPTSTWGAMVAEGRRFISISWWVVTFPGLAIMLTVLAANLLGDQLRDRLDPKLRR